MSAAPVDVLAFFADADKVRLDAIRGAQADSIGGVNEESVKRACDRVAGKLQHAQAVEAAVRELMAERDRLDALINNPQTADFLEAVRSEVAHQIERWGTTHDRAKEPADWFWLVGYLAGKALHANVAGDREKALHHTISTAAALANWWAHITLGGGEFTPGASDLQRFLEDAFGPALPVAEGK